MKDMMTHINNETWNFYSLLYNQDETMIKWTKDELMEVLKSEFAVTIPSLSIPDGHLIPYVSGMMLRYNIQIEKTRFMRDGSQVNGYKIHKASLPSQLPHNFNF